MNMITLPLAGLAPNVTERATVIHAREAGHSYWLNASSSLFSYNLNVKSWASIELHNPLSKAISQEIQIFVPPGIYHYG